jgi:hypothetical protein
MTLAPGKVYAKTTKTLWVLFDLGDPEARETLHRQRAAWGECSEIEAVDGDHAILIVRPGGAQRLAA